MTKGYFARWTADPLTCTWWDRSDRQREQERRAHRAGLIYSPSVAEEQAEAEELEGAFDGVVADDGPELVWPPAASNAEMSAWLRALYRQSKGLTEDA